MATGPSEAPFDPRHRSRTLVDGPGRAAARSYFRSVGISREDLAKPLVMVAHEWIGTMPCNFSQRALAQQVMAGIRAAQEAGLAIKLNAVALKGVNEDEIPEMVRFAHGQGMDLTLIETMPLGDIDGDRTDQYLPLSLVRARRR